MKRPKGVVAIVVYNIVGVAVIIPAVLLEFRQETFSSWESVLSLSIVPVVIVLSVRLWRMKNWARVCTVVLTASVLICAEVLMVVSGDLDYRDLWFLASVFMVSAPNLLIITYLLTPSVRRAFLSPITKY